MSNLLKRLKDKETLSDTEMVIADYLIENYRDLSNLSTRELAKKTFSSSAAIVRFCQKFGFKGYIDFKISFLSEMIKHGSEVQAQLILEQDNINSIMDKVREININAINEAYNSLNPALLSRTVKLFNEADYIDFYTIDDWRDFANRTAESFTIVDKFYTINSSMPLQYLQAYKTPKKHLAFFINPSGENRLLIDIAKLLKRQLVPSILITANPNSTLASLVTEYFTVHIGDNVEELGPLVFLTSAKYVADTLLAILIAQTDYQGAKERDIWLNKNYSLKN